jgi:hypothetical protein
VTVHLKACTCLARACSGKGHRIPTGFHYLPHLIYMLYLRRKMGVFSTANGSGRSRTMRFLGLMRRFNSSSR